MRRDWPQSDSLVMLYCHQGSICTQTALATTVTLFLDRELLFEPYKFRAAIVVCTVSKSTQDGWV